MVGHREAIGIQCCGPVRAHAVFLWGFLFFAVFFFPSIPGRFPCVALQLHSFCLNLSIYATMRRDCNWLIQTKLVHAKLDTSCVGVQRGVSESAPSVAVRHSLSVCPGSARMRVACAVSGVAVWLVPSRLFSSSGRHVESATLDPPYCWKPY